HRPSWDRGLEHGEVGLPAGRRECGSEVVLPPRLIGRFDEEHMLGEPALIAGDDRGDPQGEALLTEQRIPTVTRSVGPDFPGVGKVDDVFGVVAGPGDVLALLTIGAPQWIAHRVHGGNPRLARLDLRERPAAHPG